jgi:spore coat polysaccharide biosynthesis protein SpsF
MSKTNKVTAIIQARVGSTRLPGKVLRPLLNRPMLNWVVERVKKSRLIDEVVIATTTQSGDDAIADLCHQQGWFCYRGSENDVLDRYYQAAKQLKTDSIVRICSDCPMIDPGVCDLVIASFLGIVPRCDYLSNCDPTSYPLGLNAEIFSFNALKKAWEKDDNPEWREHVTPFIYNNPEIFNIHNIVNPVDYSSYRWTVDTLEDFSLIEKIYNYFDHGDFCWYEIIHAYEDNPSWRDINTHVQQKTV